MNSAKNNLLALGSAAVLAIYSAGYLRTKAAADQFAGDERDRRRPVPSADIPPQSNPTAAIVIDSQPIVAADTPMSVAIAPSKAPAPTAILTTARPLPPKPTADSGPKQATPAVAAAPASAKPTSAAFDSAVVPQVVAAVAPPNAPAPTPTPTPTSGLQGANGAQVTDSSVSGQPVKSQWKDGVYSGWGTSRHGDIEATVEVREGRITSAMISQCRTRYSCSWISHLPGQVVSRQSPEVDYVSGATQSTNAFYYAVVEALAKAK